MCNSDGTWYRVERGARGDRVQPRGFFIIRHTKWFEMSLASSCGYFLYYIVTILSTFFIIRHTKWFEMSLASSCGYSLYYIVTTLSTFFIIRHTKWFEMSLASSCGYSLYYVVTILSTMTSLIKSFVVCVIIGIDDVRGGGSLMFIVVFILTDLLFRNVCVCTCACGWVGVFFRLLGTIYVFKIIDFR